MSTTTTDAPREEKRVAQRSGGGATLEEVLRRVLALLLALGRNKGAETAEELLELVDERRLNDRPEFPPGMTPGPSPIGWYLRSSFEAGEELLCERCVPKPYGGPAMLAASIVALDGWWQLEPNEGQQCSRCGRRQS